tara:strand:- start:2648 stop:2941 length:294 start_codon:yes stop_codon:yes gene_type:complete
MVLTNKMKFNKRYGQKLQQPNSKKDISKLTGISMSILDAVYYRGMGAYKTNPGSVRRTVTSPQQWAMARVYSFAVGGKTRQTADADLWAKHKKNKKK